MKKLLLFVFIAAANAALAGAYLDCAKYKAGDSLAWYYQISADAVKNPAHAERELLSVLRGGAVGDEAFARICELLKPIASDACVDVLKGFLSDGFRAPWVCEVLRALPKGAADAALMQFAEKSSGENAACALSALALRAAEEPLPNWSAAAYGGSQFWASRVVELLKSKLESGSAAEKKIAAETLGYFPRRDAVSALKSAAEQSASPGAISFKYYGGAKKSGGDCGISEAARQSLCAIARKAVLNGDRSLAECALSGVGDRTYAVAIRAALAKNPVEYIDSDIISGGKNMKYAARSANSIRTFENSRKLLENFDSLSDEAKFFAIGTMIPTGDKRFYKYIAPYISSGDKWLSLEAIYAARFLCDDRAAFSKIADMCTIRDFRGADSNITVWSVPKFEFAAYKRSVAAAVLEESDSKALDAVLAKRAAAGSVDALAWLAVRGDITARNALWEKFYGGGYADAEIVLAVSKTVLFGELGEFVSKMTKRGNTKLDAAIGDIVAKKFAKSKDDAFKKREIDCLLWGVLDFDTPLYKSIREKAGLGAKSRKVGVQLSTFYNLSFVDCLPLLKRTGISHIGLTGQMTGGKYPNVKTGHNMNAEQRAYLKKLLADNRLVIVSYGVRSPDTEREIVEICEFAKEFSIPVVLTESPENLFPVWDKCAEKYGLKVAVHNHPKPKGSDYKYCYPDYLDSKIRNLKNVYCCADNGHWERDGIKTLDALAALRGKVAVVHIKDVDRFGTSEARDVVLGKGVGRVADAVAELDRQGFDGYYLIEHEVWEFTPADTQIEEIVQNADYLNSIKNKSKK